MDAVTTPGPADGTNDGAKRYKRAKLTSHQNYLEAMRAQGIRCVPLIWISWGRPRADALQTLKNMATQAEGGEDWSRQVFLCEKL